jgi:hypothetical protein
VRRARGREEGTRTLRSFLSCFSRSLSF